MSSTTLQYYLPTFTGLTSHSWIKTAFVRDIADTEEDTLYELDAQAQSGDYFVMLATTLDSLGRTVTNFPARSRLETIVSDLIYLQDHYEITKKESE